MLFRSGELPRWFEGRKWNQPVGLHITAAAGLIVAIALPLNSISSLSSAIFLAVFAVVNAAAFKNERTSRRVKAITALGFLGCAGSFVVLVANSIATDVSSMIALALLVGGALFAEHFVLKRRRPADLVLPRIIDV